MIESYDMNPFSIDNHTMTPELVENQDEAEVETNMPSSTLTTTSYSSQGSKPPGESASAKFDQCLPSVAVIAPLPADVGTTQSTDSSKSLEKLNGKKLEQSLPPITKWRDFNCIAESFDQLDNGELVFEYTEYTVLD
jgi:hypothetical protein